MPRLAEAHLPGEPGLLGYLTPTARVVDETGSLDAITARLVHPADTPTLPGGLRLAPLAWTQARYTSATPTDDRGVAAARRVLGCAPVVELRAAVGAPLTPTRMVDNLRSSWRLTWLRIPADPREAEAVLC